MSQKSTNDLSGQLSNSVLYCLVRSKIADEDARFLMLRKIKGWTFPVTKFRPGEDLYSALRRPMEEDLNLPEKSYFPERELQEIPYEAGGPKYPGLSSQWHMYPVDVSVSKEAVRKLPPVVKDQASDEEIKSCWMTITEITNTVKEPDILSIAFKINDSYKELLKSAHDKPSMDALASHWAADNEGGVRALRKNDINHILESGSRAFNLRVADPFLPYQKQGLGFTWSFFTPKDKQDVHVHGLPLVEIFGVFSGRLNLFHKHMNQRGPNAWESLTLKAGDWLEIEPLHCHFSYWLDSEGTGTVFKAAATGELGGVGELGMYGKTTCEKCPVRRQCARHPAMVEIEKIYQMDFPERDYEKISALFKQYKKEQKKLEMEQKKIGAVP